jgi:putative peptidoglycan lipid II flippase
MILGTVGLYRIADPPVRSVAYGVLIGGVWQLLIQWRSLKRQGFLYRPDFHWGDEAIRRILILLGPRVFGVAVYQVNIFVSTLLATWLPDGSVSYLYYAERLFQLPLGIFAVSVGTASLPSLSRLAARGDLEGLRETLTEALRMTAFIVLPASVGLLVLARPILVVLLQRGSFSAAMADATAQALAFYALTLIPVAGVKVVVPAFYALNDMRVPVTSAFWALCVDVAASLALMGPMKHSGLAFASTLSNAANLIYLVYHLRSRVGPMPYRRLVPSLARMILGTLVMALAVGIPAHFVAWGGRRVIGAAALGALMSLGAATYLGSTHLLGLADSGRLAGVVARRLGLRKT